MDWPWGVIWGCLNRSPLKATQNHFKSITQAHPNIIAPAQVRDKSDSLALSVTNVMSHAQNPLNRHVHGHTCRIKCNTEFLLASKRADRQTDSLPSSQAVSQPVSQLDSRASQTSKRPARQIERIRYKCVIGL